MTTQQAMPLTEPTENHDQVEIKKNAQLLYKFAWGVEIFAVTIGLVLAILQGLTTYSQVEVSNALIGTAGWFTVMIATLPFLMVAAVELTKIPLASAFYFSKLLRWRLVFGVSLALISFITFETALNGFERNFNAMMLSIQADKIKLLQLNEKHETKTNRLKELSSLSREDIDQSFERRNEQIRNNELIQIKKLQEERAFLQGSLKDEAFNRLENNIQNLRKSKDQLIAERDVEKARMSEQFEQRVTGNKNDVQANRQSVNQQIARLQKELSDLQAERKQRLEEANFFTRGSVLDEMNPRISAKEQALEQAQNQLLNFSESAMDARRLVQLNQSHERIEAKYAKQIQAIDTEIKALEKEINKNLGFKQKGIEPDLKIIEQSLSEYSQSANAQRRDNEAQKSKELAELASREPEIEKLKLELFEITSAIGAVKHSFNLKVQDNQIYRIAKWAYNKEKAEDVEEEQVAFIAAVWFGSLAFLVAFTGVILAIASFALKDKKNIMENPKKEPVFKKALRSMRRYYVAKKKIHKKPIIQQVPVEVVREVVVEKIVPTEVKVEIPVDRIVKQEVPVEVIKREIVHVPFYTNDKALVELSNVKTAPQNSQSTKEDV